MNILLVYPEHPTTFWSFKHAPKFVGKKSNLPPLGVLTIAAMLPEGWNRKAVDMNTDRLKDKDIQWTDYVFISAMNIQQDSTRSVIDRCKKLKKKTVGGGPLFTTEFENYDDVGHLLLYEGEISLPKFLNDLAVGAPKHLYGWEDYSELARRVKRSIGNCRFGRYSKSRGYSPWQLSFLYTVATSENACLLV